MLRQPTDGPRPSVRSGADTRVLFWSSHEAQQPLVACLACCSAIDRSYALASSIARLPRSHSHRLTACAFLLFAHMAACRSALTCPMPAAAQQQVWQRKQRQRWQGTWPGTAFQLCRGGGRSAPPYICKKCGLGTGQDVRSSARPPISAQLPEALMPHRARQGADN